MAIDSNSILWPESLPTPLIGRKVTTDPRNWTTAFESKRHRTRRHNELPLRTMDVIWNFTADQYEQFTEFFVTTIEQGTLPFVMVTLEQDDDPSLVREYSRELGFMEDGYSWSQSDNLFTVQAVLEIDAEEFDRISNPFVPSTEPDPIDYDFTSICRETIVMTWPISADYVSGLDTVETGESQAGPWYDYISVAATEEQKAAGLMTLYLNNSYNGERWFRIRRGEFNIFRRATNPQASVVAMPTSVSVFNTTESGMAMLTAGPFVRPLSYIENETANPTNIYIEPARRVVYQRGTNFDGIPTVVSGVVASGELRWTVDGTDPDFDTPWPPPIRGGVGYNAQAESPDFGLVVRARCFSGECRSPMYLLLVDKSHEAQSYVRLLASGQSVSGFCTLPKVSSSGTLIEGSASCAINYGGPENLAGAVSSVACGMLTANQANKVGGKWTIWKKISTIGTGTVFLGTWWDAATAGAFKFLGYDFVPSDYTNRSYWDLVPKAYEYSYADSEGEIQLKQVASPNDFERHLAGAGGGILAHTQETVTFLMDMVPTCLPMSTQTRLLDVYAVIVSAYNNSWGGEAVDPPPTPEPPVPETEDTGFKELWEEYADADPVVAVLSGGVGWSNNWVFANQAILDGTEPFDDYPLLVDGEELDFLDSEFVPMNGGEGWSDAWSFGDHRDFYGEENWEEYTDGVVTSFSALSLNKGTNWADWIPANPEFGLQPWNLQIFPGGIEDWQSYTDQVLSGAEVLNDNSDGSWIANGQWVFAGF